MEHPALESVLKEIEKDLYYFTKFGSHRVLVMDHMAKLRVEIGAALAAERSARKEIRCKS